MLTPSKKGEAYWNGRAPVAERRETKQRKDTIAEKRAAAAGDSDPPCSTESRARSTIASSQEDPKGKGKAVATPPALAKGRRVLTPIQEVETRQNEHSLPHPGSRPRSTGDPIQDGVDIEEWQRQRLIWYISHRNKTYVPSNSDYDDLKKILGTDGMWDSDDETHDFGVLGQAAAGVSNGGHNSDYYDGDDDPDRYNREPTPRKPVPVKSVNPPPPPKNDNATSTNTGRPKATTNLFRHTSLDELDNSNGKRSREMSPTRVTSTEVKKSRHHAGRTGLVILRSGPSGGVLEKSQASIDSARSVLNFPESSSAEASHSNASRSDSNRSSSPDDAALFNYGSRSPPARHAPLGDPMEANAGQSGLGQAQDSGEGRCTQSGTGPTASRSDPNRQPLRSTSAGASRSSSRTVSSSSAASVVRRARKQTTTTKLRARTSRIGQQQEPVNLGSNGHGAATISNNNRSRNNRNDDRSNSDRNDNHGGDRTHNNSNRVDNSHEDRNSRRRGRSYLEDESDAAPKKKKSTRGRLNDFEGTEKRVLYWAGRAFVAIMVSNGMYETDTDVLDNRRLDAWEQGCDKCEVDPEDYPISPAHVENLDDRLCTWRSHSKENMIKEVKHTFFRELKTRGQIMEEVERLKSGGLHTKPGSENGKGYFQHPILQTFVNECLFKFRDDIGVQFAKHFKIISAELMCYSCTIIQYLIEEWDTGVHVRGRLDNEVQRKAYHTHLKNHASFVLKSNGRWELMQEQIFLRAFVNSGAPRSSIPIDEKNLIEEAGILADEPSEAERAAWREEMAALDPDGT
ncbi:hypothetical protein RSOLAG22IIIB_08138 [Rhizoctonia solani]|uniref:DUF6532 domain-containing protein n=1 Tax=Rhizoctonia solani TaxID=456999 RepID=A0A0K6FRS6_9AGAM|nr:hypothetical protein RSOLAG22IIIB_08138 [Rhizoctonia solani]